MPFPKIKITEKVQELKPRTLTLALLDKAAPILEKLRTGGSAKKLQAALLSAPEILNYIDIGTLAYKEGVDATEARNIIMGNRQLFEAISGTPENYELNDYTVSCAVELAQETANLGNFSEEERALFLTPYYDSVEDGTNEDGTTKYTTKRNEFWSNQEGEVLLQYAESFRNKVERRPD
jgi:hypothetical protein